LVTGQGHITRRTFLQTAATGAAAVGALAVLGHSPASAQVQPATGLIAQHLSWVWEFQRDGSKEEIRDVLAAHGLGILLKTHDGTNWMSRFDKAPDAVTGPEQVRNLVRFFEAGGVPCHAWCVLKGLEPVHEAQMAAEVIAAGVRSIYLDLEPSDGGYYWQGTPNDAAIFGREFRRLQPTAYVSLAPDARPWQAAQIPMAQFVPMANEIAPQAYWRTFNSPANYRLLTQHGFHVGEHGVTPELIVDVTDRTFRGYGLPIRPIGQGAASGHEWERFVGHSYYRGMDAVSVWRHGVSNPEVWPVLKHMAPRQLLEVAALKEQRNQLAVAAPPQPAPEPAPVSHQEPAPVEQRAAQRQEPAPTEQSEAHAAAVREADQTPEEQQRTIRLASRFQFRTQPLEVASAAEEPSRVRRLFWDLNNLRGLR
jgi:hypothetical protein